MNKRLYFYIYFILIVLLFGVVHSKELKKDQYESLVDLFSAISDNYIDTFFTKNSTGSYDFCLNNKVVICNEENVASLKLSPLDSEYATIEASNFGTLVLDSLEISLFDLDSDFIEKVKTNKLVLDHCVGFEIDKLNGLEMKSLDVTIDNNYWESNEKKLQIDAAQMKSLQTFKFSYQGEVNENVSITLQFNEQDDSYFNWDLTLTEFPVLKDESKFDYLVVRLLNTTNSYKNIESYIRVKNLGIVSANPKSPISLNSTTLFESIAKILDGKKNDLAFFGTDIPLTHPSSKISLDKSTKSKLSEIKIKNAGDFNFKGEFPFEGFPSSLKILTFNNWNGGKVNFTNIKNSDQLETINMKSSSLRMKLNDLNIPSKVQTLDLSDNDLMGTVSDDLCYISSSKLSNNYLFGELPSCYSCYPSFQSSFTDNKVTEPTQKCDYNKIYNSLKVGSETNDKDVLITVNGENIGFTTDEFNKDGGVEWRVVKANSQFEGIAKNQSINGYTNIMFNGNRYLLPFKWVDINVDSIHINQTASATLITLNGDHFSFSKINTNAIVNGKNCSVLDSSYLSVSLECKPKFTGITNITVQRTDNGGSTYSGLSLDLSMKDIIFCKQNCIDGTTCDLSQGKCKANNNNNNGGKDDGGKDDGGKDGNNNGKDNEDDEENQIKVDNTSNVVLGLIILVFVVGVIYIAYTKFLSPNSTSTQNSSYRNLRVRDEEEFEDGIPMKTREDSE